MEFIETDDTKQYFTIQKIGIKQDDGSIKLLTYDTDLYLTDFLKPKKLNENMTLTEKTLREILIPKNNLNDISLFQDFHNLPRFALYCISHASLRSSRL